MRIRRIDVRPPMTVTAGFLTFVPAYAEWARANPRIRRAWVFGSRLRGTQTPDSDIDLALEIDPLETDDETMGWWMFEKERWTEELQAISPYRVQLEWFGGEATPKIQQYLACCSMLVYERTAQQRDGEGRDG
jgi:predicted nucleotidyltransferase